MAATSAISPALLATPTLTPAPPATRHTPPATPNPYADLTIDALAARSYGGGDLEIVETLERNERFARYLITYPSDGLTIYGYMTVPAEGSRFPVVLMLHGYIPPDEYETVTYTRRYADALAEAGYFVIHPNFRNYPPSDSAPDPFRIGFAIDVLNLIAIVRAQSQDPLAVAVVNNAEYVKSAVLYGAMSGDEAQNYARIRQWSNGRRGQFELAAPPETLRAISPIHHLERLRAAVAIHHSDADEIVPLAWSEDLCARLQARNHPVACFTYRGAPHTFIPPWDDLFMARVVDFYGR